MKYVNWIPVMVVALILSLGIGGYFSERDNKECLAATYSNCTTAYPQKDCALEARLVCIGTVGCQFDNRSATIVK